MSHIEHIKYLEDVTLFYAVDESGEPTVQDDTTGGDFVGYVCEQHGEDFKRWEDVRAHLTEYS